MPSPDRHLSGSEESEVWRWRSAGDKEREATPPRPSYSPVTPTLSDTHLPSPGHSTRQPPEWIDEPDPLPLNLEDNPDAIALRAAISILQLQRQQSLRDIRNLDKMKAAAIQRPEAFIEDLKAGKLAQPPPVGVVNVDAADSSDDDDDASGGKSRLEAVNKEFGMLPTSQNVVRCPPIDWAKYHVVGESLDRLHEDQRKRPGSGELTEEDGERVREHVIAAPYSPFVDKIDRSPIPRSQPGRTT